MGSVELWRGGRVHCQVVGVVWLPILDQLLLDVGKRATASPASVLGVSGS